MYVSVCLSVLNISSENHEVGNKVCVCLLKSIQLSNIGELI